jgi:CelD/BcsL family acetyltransferase involved in cellulose biosynthesis
MNAVRASVTTDAGLFFEPHWDALAGEVGTVFHTGRFLSAWWSDTAVNEGGSDLIMIQVNDGPDHIGQCAFELRGDALRFAGGGDVVDYMGPLAARGREGDVAGALAEIVCDKLPWRTTVFEGLVGSDRMTRLLIDEFGRRRLSMDVSCYDYVPRIQPGPTAFLSRLNAKRRKEVLRKRSRLADAVGEVTVAVSDRSHRSDALDRLLAWKADATPATGEFVARYGAFVRQLVGVLGDVDEARIVDLVGADRPLASAIVFMFRGTRLLYNMSYDPTWLATAPAGLAPGVVLVSHLAEQAVDAGEEFDFLKGRQDYKTQLGGVPDELMRLKLSRTPSLAKSPSGQ